MLELVVVIWGNDGTSAPELGSRGYTSAVSMPTNMADDTLTDAIRSVLREHGRLAVDVTQVTDVSNLYDAGLTSQGSVALMLALEEHFDIEFPDRMLRRNAFASIAIIRAGIQELIGEVA
jgi:acyl carrier protein